MSKEEPLEFSGKVIEVLPKGAFKVELEGNAHQIIAYSAGKIRKNRIKIIKGDKVSVEMTLYDLNRGRIVHISRDKAPPRKTVRRF